MEIFTLGIACFAFLWLAVLFFGMSARITEGSVAVVTADTYRPMPETQAIEYEGGACDSSKPTRGGERRRLSTSSYRYQACRGTETDLCRDEEHGHSRASGGGLAEGLADP